MHRWKYRSHSIKSIRYGPKLNICGLEPVENMTAHYKCDQRLACCRLCYVVDPCDFEFNSLWNLDGFTSLHFHRLFTIETQQDAVL
jgi:hypothetical protein